MCETLAQRIRRQRAERKPGEILATIQKLTSEAERRTWASYQKVLDSDDIRRQVKDSFYPPDPVDGNLDIDYSKVRGIIHPY